MQIIDVVVASDHKFFDGLQTTIMSVALHEKLHQLKIHVLDGGLKNSQWESLFVRLAKVNPDAILIRHHFDQNQVAGFCDIRELSLMTYARVLVPAFIEAEYAIYVDSDFLITKPISELLQYRDERKAIGASMDLAGDLSKDCPWGRGLDLSSYTYVNCGLMLMNLGRWRNNGHTERILSFLQKESGNCRYADQSAINWLLRSEICVIPQEWNTMANSFDEGLTNHAPGSINLHFASGMKPWKRPLPTPSHKIWWLFNRLFISQAGIPNPLVKPRNLLRYVLHWVRIMQKAGNSAQIANDAFHEWKSYWKELNISMSAV